MCQIAIGCHLCDIFLRHRKFHFVKIHEIQNLRIRERITFMPDLLQRILSIGNPASISCFVMATVFSFTGSDAISNAFSTVPSVAILVKEDSDSVSARYFYLKGNVLPQFQTDIRIHFCIHQDILQKTDLRIIALPGDHLSSEGLPGNQCTDLPVYLFGIRIIWSLYSAVIRYFIL